MGPQELITRFRADVDDRLMDEDDGDSALLWSKADVEFYVEESQRQFVAGTFYLHGVREAPVVADDPVVRLSDDIIQLRGNEAVLVEAQTVLKEQDALNEARDDYGAYPQNHPLLETSQPGQPQTFSLDVNTREIRLFPTPDTDDTLRFSAFLEAPSLRSNGGALVIRNPRHVMMLLDGMKALAYAKQDADAYDPRQSERFALAFARSIRQVRGERMRRRRRPGEIVYGGL